MRHDYIGMGLLKIAAFLYAARYIAAAIFMGPGLSSWSSNMFESAYSYVGSALTVWAVLAALAGIVVLVVGARRKSGNEPCSSVEVTPNAKAPTC